MSVFKLANFSNTLSLKSSQMKLKISKCNMITCRNTLKHVSRAQ